MRAATSRGLHRAAGEVALAPLWAHAASLLAGMVILLPVVGTDAAYSADEGAVIIQARSLAAGDGWIIPHPMPDLDAGGALYPLELSAMGPDGAAAYAKHPAYPWVLSLAERAGGHEAMVVLSLLGTWVAALGAAAVARQLLGGLARSSFWVAGAGCPLLFNGYWVIAHSLAAAAIAWATITFIALTRSSRLSSSLPLVLAAPVLALVAGLLRTEAVIFTSVLAVAGVVVAALARRSWALGGAVLIGAAGVVARAVDSELVGRIVGGPVGSTGAFEPRERGGAVGDRLDGFVATWLRAAPTGEDAAAMVVVVAVLLTVLAALAMYQRAERAAAALATMAAALLVARLLLVPTTAIPGLLMAFPLLLVGVVGALAAPAMVDRRSAGLVLWVVAAGWAGVLLTQYAEGGVTEWGGRYFALGLPLAVPLVLAGVHALLARLSVRTAPLVTVGLVVAMAALSLSSIREIRHVHENTASVLKDIAALAVQAGPNPVIVTDAPSLPRLDWARFDEHRWLLADPAEVPDLPERLAAEGVDRWVLVSADGEGAVDAFDSLVVVSEVSPSILLVEHAP